MVTVFTNSEILLGIFSKFLQILKFALTATGTSSASTYLIGLGSYDITGPAADVNMMGYANLEQIASGVHFRLRARAFIVAEPRGNRIVFVNLDACMGSQIVTIKLLDRLKARYGDLYTEQNVAISGIHTHAGPGGYLQYVVYIVTSLGFVRQSFDVIVDGIEKSIVQAHENLRPGSIFVNKGELLDAGVNRSPSAYLNNPAAERSKYKSDVDKEMTLIKFVDDVWGPIGSFNWFATHGTSMSRTNSLISGDNKGAAARFMEDWFERNGIDSLYFNKSKTDSIPRRVSEIVLNPNGNRNELIKLAASFQSSRGRPVTKLLSIAKRILDCHVILIKAPAMVEMNCAMAVDQVTQMSLRVLDNWGEAIQKSSGAFDKATEKLKGKIRYQHAYIDFSNLNYTLPQMGGGNKVVKTCPAALGFSFAAGTTDGPGAFDFKQGDDKGNAFWRLVRNLLKKPTQEQISCQHPKPIVLDTGEMKEPYAWAPSVLSVQLFQIGQLVILSVPGGLTNTYSQYVTTFEEYQVQRYEGASTLYGPHTLEAYIQEFKKLARAIITDKTVEPGPQPPDLLDKQISLLPPVVLDATPLVNDLMTEGTFALVEILKNKKTWLPAYDDDDFCLRFKWSRPEKLSPWSYATIEWRIPQSAAPGIYRITHFGASRHFWDQSAISQALLAPL
ncbi:hypothetical protein FNV43_RR09720 [Rhamnella rubrinervis]|uniref:Neutral ceramidase n=1 Tax=Rhamnella rubrinervis TaxID=2594499 RepID=A0A8K0HAG8_9ROSA|nr:hypothetical protein FNV43_RR09720 [Rhamnella rubrinervis]